MCLIMINSSRGTCLLITSHVFNYYQTIIAERHGYQRLPDDSYQKLKHASEDDVTLEIFGYKKCRFYCFLFQLFGLLFLGLPHLLVAWYKQLLVLKFRRCSLKSADTVLGN